MHSFSYVKSEEKKCIPLRLPLSNVCIHLRNKNGSCLVPLPFPRRGEEETLRPVHVTAMGSLKEGEVSDSNPFLQAQLISPEIALMN